MTSSALQRVDYNLADPNDFKCYDATLPPLPVDKILKIAQATLREMNVENSYHRVNDGHLFEITKVLYRWFDENLRFRDWKYTLESLAHWEDGRITIEISAIKKYTRVSLVLGQEVVYVNHELAEYASSRDGTLMGYNDYSATAADLLTWLFDVFDEVNKRIDFWNKICRFSVPIFSEPLPRNLIVARFLDVVVDQIEMWICHHDYEDATLEEKMEIFLEEVGYLSGIDLAEIWDTGWYVEGFGPKNDWVTWANVEFFEDWSWFSFYVSRRGSPLVFKVLEFEEQGFGYAVIPTDAGEIIEGALDEAEAAMISWNESMTRKFESSLSNLGSIFGKKDKRFEIVDYEDGIKDDPFLRQENVFYESVLKTTELDNVDIIPGQMKLPFKEET